MLMPVKRLKLRRDRLDCGVEFRVFLLYMGRRLGKSLLGDLNLLQIDPI
jgi:hypothetical protein